MVQIHSPGSLQIRSFMEIVHCAVCILVFPLPHKRLCELEASVQSDTQVECVSLRFRVE